jgi:hypothetical protein
MNDIIKSAVNRNNGSRSLIEEESIISGKEPVEIKAYSAEDRNAWNDFVLSSENSTFFHRIEWKDIIEKSFSHKSLYMLALKNEKIEGVFPLFEVKNILFGHSLISLPSVVYGGICAADKEAEQSLYRSAETLGRLMGVDYVEMRNQFRPLNEFPFLDRTDSTNAVNTGADGCFLNGKWITKDLYVNFERMIYPDVDTNLKAIPRKQRRMIRQGIKAGLESKIGREEYLDIFYDLYARNLKNHGTPVFSHDFFRNIMLTFPDAFILTVWKDNMIVAAVLTFAFKDRIIPYFSGTLSEYNRYAINDFMYWELMKYGCERGFKLFDFGRSKKDTGSFHFKRHWGFEPETLPFLYHLVERREMPEVNPSNPKYSLMINLWRKLPLTVTKWMGPRVNRYIP